MKAKLAVVGSINMDIVNRVVRHPLPGETVHGLETVYSPGGKGANQAVAASRNGADVFMVGAVGEDPFAEPLLATLESAGVDCTRVCRKNGNSGMAFITVSRSGENNIILSEGSNGRLTPSDVEAGLSGLDGLQGVLFQNEIPWETTVCGIQAAKRLGATVYLNPAPAREVPDEVLASVDVLIVNETEAHTITGLDVGGREEAASAAALLFARGVREVIVTLGAAGSLYVHRDGEIQYTEAFRVQAVDTTAAGDTFIGVYAACRANGLPNEEALRMASAASALAVTRAGAQSSIPALDEVRAFSTR